jgi:hypothetical protein
MFDFTSGVIDFQKLTDLQKQALAINPMYFLGITNVEISDLQLKYERVYDVFISTLSTARRAEAPSELKPDNWYVQSAFMPCYLNCLCKRKNWKRIELIAAWSRMRKALITANAEKMMVTLCGRTATGTASAAPAAAPAPVAGIAAGAAGAGTDAVIDLTTDI